MKCMQVFAVSLGIFFFGAMLAPPAHADDGTLITRLTFSAPVEIPGKVLAAGTYEFRLADPILDPDVVEILDKDGMHLIAIVMVNPDSRLAPTDKTVIKFKQRAPGAPEAITEWFSPGETDGYQFCYPPVKSVAPANISLHSAAVAIHK